MKFIVAPRLESTNSAILGLDDACHATALMAKEQTAGRGQRGNSWEAEAGMNITMSILLEPRWVKASEQFSISEAVSLAIVDELRPLIGSSGDVAIKWPNDIYVGNKKICGILIENALLGNGIMRSVIGIGINVNQSLFLSDAPNPISLNMITGNVFDCEALAHRVAERVVNYVELLQTNTASLHERYCESLWRGEGLYPYRDVASGNVFEACISNIGPMGHITLTDNKGVDHVYAFKEVESIIL